MRLIKVACCAILCSAGTLSHQAYAAEPADWMSGEFGVSWRINVDPDRPHFITNFNVSTLVDQVKSIPRVKYVIMNLSRGAYGDLYLAPHSVLSSTNPTSFPGGNRDLFMELATAFKAEGIKVIGYIACQGPALLKHGAAVAHDKELVNGQWQSDAMDRWAAYVQAEYGRTWRIDYKRAFAEVIFEEYAERYGTLVDGWWFDNGSDNYDAQMLYDIALQHNPNSTMASNGHQSYMAFRNGHPTPMAQASPSDPINESYLLEPIEATTDGYFTASNGDRSLGHMYMPIQRQWNGGAVVWDVAQGIDWKSRCLHARGAWTWNVDMDDSLFRLKTASVDLIKDIVAGITDMNDYSLVQIRKRNALDFCLNFGGTDPFNGQNVKLWSYAPDHIAMTWEEVDLGNGFFAYRKKGTNFSLDGGNGGANQQNVYLWKTDVDNYNQQWQKVNKGGGYIQLKKRNAAYSVNGGNGGANMQNVNLFNSSSTSQNLQWKIEYR